MISENATLVASAAGIITAIGWGISDWLIAKNSKKFGTFEINFGGQVVGSIIVGGLWLVSDLHAPTASQLVKILGADVLITIAYLLFVKAMSSGATGIIAPLGNSFALPTVLLSVIFLDEAFSAWQFFAMVGIVIGAGILAYEKNHKKIPLRELHESTMFALAAALIWGVAFFILNPLVDEVSWQVLTITAQSVLLPVGVVAFLLSERSNSLESAKRVLSSRAIIALGSIGTIASIIFYVGADYAGSILIPAVIASGGPLVTSLLGAVVDKESLGVIKRIGAVIVVTGIIILNLT